MWWLINHLDEISVEELQDAPDNVDGHKSTQQLLAAIAYKNGVTQTELAEWHDTDRRAIYNWLGRLDTDEPLEQGTTDDHRSGRKQKLSEKQQQELKHAVHESPQEIGFDAPTWTPALVEEFLEETHDIEYSLPNCRRLLKQVGLSCQIHAAQPLNPTKKIKKRFTTRYKKRREMDATAVCIDQIKKSVQVELRGFRAVRGPRSNYRVNGTGRACLARSSIALRETF